MTIDDDKRDLSNVSQKEPAAFGRIRQRAMDLGMSTQEFILSHDPERTKQAAPATPNASEEILKELIKEVKALKETPRIPPYTAPQASDPFASLKGFVEAMKTLRAYDNEVITGHTAAVDRALSMVPDEAPDEAPEDDFFSFLKQLPQHQAQAAPSWDGGPVHNYAVQTPPPAPQSPTMPQKNPMEQLEAQVPTHIKAMIRSGQISKELAISEGKKQYPQAKDEDIAALYDHIKGAT